MRDLAQEPLELQTNFIWNFLVRMLSNPTSNLFLVLVDPTTKHRWWCCDVSAWPVDLHSPPVARSPMPPRMAMVNSTGLPDDNNIDWFDQPSPLGLKKSVDTKKKRRPRHVANIIISALEEAAQNVYSKHSQAAFSFNWHDGQHTFVQNRIASVLGPLGICSHLCQDVIHLVTCIYLGPFQRHELRITICTGIF